MALLTVSIPTVHATNNDSNIFYSTKDGGIWGPTTGGNGVSIETYVWDTDDDNWGLIEFTLDSLSGTTINRATLYLYTIVYTGAGNTAYIHRITGPAWNEASIGWDNRPGYDLTADGSFSPT